MFLFFMVFVLKTLILSEKIQKITKKKIYDEEKLTFFQSPFSKLFSISLNFYRLILFCNLNRFLSILNHLKICGYHIFHRKGENWRSTEKFIGSCVLKAKKFEVAFVSD